MTGIEFAVVGGGDGEGDGALGGDIDHLVLTAGENQRRSTDARQ